MKSLSQIINRYMYRITFILVGIILVFLMLVQMLTEQFRMVDDSHMTIQQIEQVLEDNQKELSYIFSLFRVDTDSNYYAIDRESGEVVGSTDLDIVGLKAADLGFDMDRIEHDPDGFHDIVKDNLEFCVFAKSGSNYIGRTVSAQNIYRRIPMTMLWIALSLFIMALILSKTVVRHMDKYVVQGIHDVNEELLAISEGNLSTKVEVKSSTELAELSEYVNVMVRSLLENNRRIAYILNKTNLHIGTYEYGSKITGVRFSEHIPVIFGVSADVIEKLSNDREGFKAFLCEVRNKAVPNEEGIYCLDERYIRIEEMINGDNIFGLAVDVTGEVKKRKEIERERDMDTLTGLLNRRGLEERLTELFAEPEQLGYSALVMIDADGLKGINDTYGHEKGDVYLKKIANIINNFGIKSSISSRLGGDEYVLFLYDYDSEDELIRTIETLRYIQSNSTASLDKNITVPMRFSFGYSLTGDVRDYNKLLKEADDMMYRDKAERKKQIIT